MGCGTSRAVQDVQPPSTKTHGESSRDSFVLIRCADLHDTIEIGRHKFGKLWRARLVRSGSTEVAVKDIFDSAVSPEVEDDVLAEVQQLEALSHNNIVKVYGVCLEEPHVALIVEFLSRGRVSDLIFDDAVTLPLERRVKMCVDTAAGLDYLHECGELMPELAPTNIFLDAAWNAKIGPKPITAVTREHKRRAGVAWTDTMMETNYYSARELIDNVDEAPTRYSDVYTYGIVALEIVQRRQAFEYESAHNIMFMMSEGGGTPVLAENLPSDLRNLLSTCWLDHTSHRPSLTNICTLLGAYLTKLSSDTVDHRAPSGNNVTIVRTKIYGYGKLWTAVPQDMGEAVNVCNDIIRECSEDHGGYHRKLRNDEFLISFGNTTNALWFCLKLQSRLLKAPWPSYDAKAPRHPLMKKVVVGQTLLFNGLRLQIAVLRGTVATELNPITDLTEYHGALVDDLNMLCSMARGGQILCAKSLADEWIAEVKNTSLAKSLNVAIHTGFLAESISLEVVPISSGACQLRQEHFDQSESMELVPERDACPPDESYFKRRLPQAEALPIVLHHCDLAFGTRIGQGSFGAVYHGWLMGEAVAIKQIHREKLNEKVLNSVKVEIAVIAALSHPNILAFRGSCDYPTLCIVTEFLSNGDLTNRMQDMKPWSRKHRIRVLGDVCAGMQYLHELEILHRDLKSPNLLLGEDNVAKIADFGLSRLKAASNTMTKCGTMAWVAPEILAGDPYSYPADVFSFGVIMSEVYTRRRPYEGSVQSNLALARAVLNGLRPDVPPDCPPEFMDLMCSCWHKDPDKRPSFIGGQIAQRVVILQVKQDERDEVEEEH